MPKIRINSDIPDLDREMVRTVVSLFIEKYHSILDQCDVEIYMREHREKNREQRLTYTRIQMMAHKDKFDATAEDWGVEHSLKSTLEKLEKQVLKKKTSKKHHKKRGY